MSATELEKARGLVAALERGDEAGYETQLAQMLRERENSLFVSVARLTRELHQAIFDQRLDGHLSSVAHDQIPDACSRLDYVVKLTENAAHKSLDLVDQGRDSLRSLKTVGDLLSDMPESASLNTARSTLSSGIEALRGQLTQLAQAQEYQDLSGQLIKRVISLVRGVESALLDLLRAAGSLPGGVAPVSKPVSNVSNSAAPVLQGPAVPGLNGAQINQQDADALLSSLGF